MPTVLHHKCVQITSFTTVLMFLLLTTLPSSAYAITGTKNVIEHDVSASQPDKTFTKKEQRRLLKDLRKSNRARLKASDERWETRRANDDSFGINGFAIAGFICGVVGILANGGLILGILAIIFSAIGLARIRKGRGGNLGRGLAIAGLVLGILALLVDVNL